MKSNKQCIDCRFFNKKCLLPVVKFNGKTCLSKRTDDKYINVEVEITKVSNEKILLAEEFPSHYTDENITEILWDRYTDKYGELKEVNWKEL